QQLGLQHFVAVVDVIGDADAGLLREAGDGVLGDVVGVVVDVEDLLLGATSRPLRGIVLAATGDKQGGGNAQGEQAELHRRCPRGGWVQAVQVSAGEGLCPSLS